MLKANYHTHCKLCNHAVGMPEDYIKKAIELGFKEIGISDHAPVPEEFMSAYDYEYNWLPRIMKLNEFYEIYLPSLDEAIKKYGDKIKIYKALETEYIPGHEDYYLMLKKDLDYINFGVHYFLSDGKELNSYDDVNYKTIYDYAKIAIMGMESGIYNALVHPDLFYFQYKDENGKHTFDKHCEEVSRMIIEAAIKNNVYLEVNANGPANSRKYGVNGSDWLYPLKEFWTIAKEYPSLKIIIGSDAHDPNNLWNQDVSDVYSFTKELGLNVSSFMEINK